MTTGGRALMFRFSEFRLQEHLGSQLLLFRRAFLCLSLSFASSFVLKLLEVIPGAGMTVRCNQESRTEFSNF